MTPIARQILQRFPALDYVLCGEPEITLRELVDTIDGREGCLPEGIAHPCAAASEAPRDGPIRRTLGAIRGLAWRHEGEIVINPPRPLLPRLDDLPLPAHGLLPLSRYGAPAAPPPTAVVVTGRGCPGTCTFCLKHVTYRQSLRLRSPESIVEELFLLQQLGVRHVYMQADLFTACRDQIEGLCRLVESERLSLSWSCSSRVDLVDEELLRRMGRAGCRWITWSIESGSETLLWRNGKGTRPQDAERAVAWARAAGIRNWGSFILGLPGETEGTIGQTVELAKRLHLDRVIFELAVPRPGTPLWDLALAQNWLKPHARWEEADAAGPAVLSYPGLEAARLDMWLERAYREWALRPGSRWGHLGDLTPVRARAARGRVGGPRRQWVPEFYAYQPS